jgi:phosphatidylglycerophosphate synthase
MFGLSELKAMTRTPPTDDSAIAADALPALRRGARRSVAPCFLILAGLAIGLAAAGQLGAWFVVKALIVFAAAMLPMFGALSAHAPHRSFGAANRITLLRLALIALLAAGIGETPPDAIAAQWTVVAIAATAALLDAVDGPLARASGLSSPFGARFDMECDAFLTLVLSVLVLAFDKAGPWIVASGLMRYAFVLASWAWPWLARPTPPRLWRKTICVVQISSLIVCLAPIVATSWSQAIAAASLLALCGSFGADVHWLMRRRFEDATNRPLQGQTR